jgi:hypothetical protein
MRGPILRQTIVAILTTLSLGLTAEQARAQISGSSAAGGGKHSSGSIQPPGTTAPTMQTTQTQQQQQALPSQALAQGIPSQAGVNQLLQYAAVSALQQQPTTLDGLLQQQAQLALVSTVQQLQLAGQAQAIQLQQNAVAAAARKQQEDAEARAAQRRKSQTFSADDLDSLFPKTEVKRLEHDGADEASARQLKMAKQLKTDADRALVNGERVESAKLKAKVGQRLADIIEKYPKTPAAKEADALIESLYR